MDLTEICLPLPPKSMYNYTLLAPILSNGGHFYDGLPTSTKLTNIIHTGMPEANLVQIIPLGYTQKLES